MNLRVDDARAARILNDEEEWQYSDAVTDLLADRATLLAEVERLTKLAQYTDHTPHCTSRFGRHDDPCTCGLDKVCQCLSHTTSANTPTDKTE